VRVSRIAPINCEGFDQGKDGMIAALRAAVADADRRAAEIADQYNQDKQKMLDKLLAAQSELAAALGDRNTQGDRYSKMLTDLQARLEAANIENSSLRLQLADERAASEVQACFLARRCVLCYVVIAWFVVNRRGLRRYNPSLERFWLN
jgi:hypothetical protein